MDSDAFRRFLAVAMGAVMSATAVLPVSLTNGTDDAIVTMSTVGE